MGTCQPGAVLSLPGVTMLEPGDVRDLYNCLNWAIGESRGAVFVRVHRSEIKPFVRNNEDNKNIRYYVPFKSERESEVTIVASGFTTGPSIEAATHLDATGLSIQVINIIDHKSLDENFTKLFPSGKPVLTVYNGSAQVLQSNVARAIMEHGVSFPSKIIGHGFEYGTTGKLEDLARHFKLDKEGIIEIIRNIIKA